MELLDKPLSCWVFMPSKCLFGDVFQLTFNENLIFFALN